MTLFDVFTVIYIGLVFIMFIFLLLLTLPEDIKFLYFLSYREFLNKQISLKEVDRIVRDDII